MADSLLLLDTVAEVEATPQPLATCLALLKGCSTLEEEGSQGMGDLFLLGQRGQAMTWCSVCQGKHFATDTSLQGHR